MHVCKFDVKGEMEDSGMPKQKKNVVNITTIAVVNETEGE